jgi:small subunit ribosomal protein S9
MVKLATGVRERMSPEAKRAPVAQSTGRRKSAVARVICRHGSGKIVVNGYPADTYFTTLTTRLAAQVPLTVVPNVAQHYDFTIKVHGGGVCAQADAIKLGISRSLVELHPDVRGALRIGKHLTRDPRQKERKKPGQKAARRKFQFVKR